LETNLFLAPGEGEAVAEQQNGAGATAKEAALPDAASLIRGDV
jgi:hypothetical protein